MSDQPKFASGKPDRRAEVMKMLNDTFDDLTKKIELLKKEYKEVPDTFTCYLQGKGIDAEILRWEVDSFENEKRHFTKKYRTLEGNCNKLLTEIDKVSVIGRDDLKDLRKQTIKNVNQTLEILSSKVHESGSACKDCEVKN